MTAYGKLIDEREKSLERLATVVRDSNDAIILFDLNGVILQWNHGAEQMYGYSEKDALGINILNIVPENKRELDRGMMNRLRRGELVKSLETQRQTKDGRILEVWLTITVLYDETGKSYAIATTERDITERNRLEKSLERLATVVRDSNDAIILFDLNGVILQWNHGAEQMYGYSEKDALGINILNIVPENKRELDRGMMNRLRRGELVKSLETQRQTKDGRILEVWLTITVLYDETGKSYAIATTERDITERNRLEKSLERLATVVRDSNDAIILFDLNGVILQWNHGAEQMYGYSEKDALGINILNIVPEDKREKDKEMMNSLRRGELVKSLETQRQTKDGRILEVWLTITVLYDEAGKSYAIATTERDITERNKIERELIQAREGLERKVQERTKELEKANLGLKALAEERKRAEDESVKAKEQTQLYLDLMSHDINNLNQTAMGFLELALNTLESKKMIELDNKLLIEKPFKALTDSSALINNVRKLQRLMEEGVKTKPIDISEILNGLNVRSLYPEGRDITINIQPVPHYMVEANELLHDVFSNLITNAVKHSEVGNPVTVDVKVEPVKENGQPFYKCIVEDNGPGIADEMKTKLFHRFQRGTTKTQGKGLGLYLVRTLVEGYHGKVWVEDRVQGDHTKGAKFIVLLPVIEN